MENREDWRLDIFGDEIHIDHPLSFALSALREIACYQVFRNKKTEIQIIQDGTKNVISRSELKKAKRASDKEREEFLNDFATRMRDGERIIIKFAPVKSKPKRTYNLRPKVIDLYTSALGKFINDNPNFSHLDEQWNNRKH